MTSTNKPSIGICQKYKYNHVIVTQVKILQNNLEFASPFMFQM